MFLLQLRFLYLLQADLPRSVALQDEIRGAAGHHREVQQQPGVRQTVSGAEVSQQGGGWTGQQPRYRYGKKQLERMAVNLASEEYLKDNAQNCPHCNAPIEKNQGCNKVSQEEPQQPLLLTRQSLRLPAGDVELISVGCAGLSYQSRTLTNTSMSLEVTYQSNLASSSSFYPLP